MLQIVEVHLQTHHHLVDGVGIAVLKRGIAGNAWAQSVEALVATVALHNLVDVVFPLRARTHKGHIAREHIPKLRQLVEVMGAQETAYACQSRVVVLLQQLLALFLCVNHHAAELVDVERPPTESDTLLLINGRPAT